MKEGSGDEENGSRKLEERVEHFIEHLRETAIIAENPSGNQALFSEKIEEMLEGFNAIDALRHSIDVEVPLEVLKFIDEGRNPDLYTKQSLELCTSKNAITRGKFDAIKSLRDGLEEEIKKVMPKTWEEYENEFH
eukprot:TRINITY_DN4418_c0_g1_i1.p1 TRINITY_DN4418_c0_g1~~TRINITY_DN4418_c0_g1_i1.p1  ORF type:complete len:156 (-),score=33.59 TRINITY_DN4418_c0_g1_i1:54-458(-)